MNITKSIELYDQACELLPGGTPFGKNPNYFIRGKYPIYASKGKGAYFWDVDGNKFIDYIPGYGSIALGYCNDVVDNEAIRAIREGSPLPLTNPLQNRLAELFIEVVPCAEKVRFFKTGSDATTAAVRIARIYTGKNKIIKWGYGGWHDWATPNPAGVPKMVKDDILTFRYNDLNSLEEVFNQNKDEVAAVIMMPFELRLPEEGFLEKVKEIAHKNNALFILDEMRTGFRMALGGAQEYFNVMPDMATFGKAMANGYAISALAGSDEIMKSVEQTRFSSTHFTNSLEIAAAIATIEQIKNSNVVSYVWETGEKLLTGINALIRDKGIEAETLGVGPMPFFVFTYDQKNWFNEATGEFNPVKEAGSRVERAWKTFYSKTIENGVFFHPNHHWFITGSHTQEDIDYTLSVCEQAFDAVKKIV